MGSIGWVKAYESRRQDMLEEANRYRTAAPLRAAGATSPLQPRHRFVVVISSLTYAVRVLGRLFWRRAAIQRS